ncbi:hypothetical protein ACFV4K_04265 [Nocardia sp. NPDC059764]|uniref:hypothetical protein n=1 Tax=Nocardia sp. NPDC059764 TaxID=3346939 RepID=UPI0036607F4E
MSRSKLMSTERGIANLRESSREGLPFGEVVDEHIPDIAIGQLVAVDERPRRSAGRPTR